MAGRILNRRELRKQADQAGQTEAAEGVAADGTTPVAAPKKASRAKAPAAPKARKPRAKKAAPRMFARWGIFDGSVRQVAIFDYNQRAAADQKLADLRARNKGVYYLQIVKEAMAEPEPAEALPAE